jgi:hypothetical protein
MNLIQWLRKSTRPTSQNFDKVWEDYVAAHDNARRSSSTSLNCRWGESYIMNGASPWKDYPAADPSDAFPHMLTDEEISYLSWISKELIGKNDVVVEIGPWLGKSTRLLTFGKEARTKILTIDDFIWRSVWMDPYVDGIEIPKNGETFLPLFKKLNSDFENYIDVLPRRLNIYEGNDQVKELQKDEIPSRVDLLFVDCGRTIEVNETWWRLFEPSFVSGETLIVMQDWRLWRESPQKFYNQTHYFTGLHKTKLQPIHEVCEGGLAAFLYV